MEAMAVIHKSWQQISVESEARRICDERDIRDMETYERVCASLRHREFMRSIEPYLKMKALVSMRMLDRIVLNNDGLIARTEYKPLPAEAEKALDQIEEMILAEARRWGFTAPSTPPRTSP